MTWGGARKGAGQKKGYESTQRKTGDQTKTSRVPIHWDIVDIHEGLELIDSILDDARNEIKASARTSKNNRPSNRLWKLEEYHKQLRKAFPSSWK